MGALMAVSQEFSYRALEPAGGAIIKGTVAGSSEGSVANKLKAQGLTPLEVVSLSKTGLNRDIGLPSLSGKVKAKSLAVFARQMSALIGAGLPLMRTLAILIEQTEDKKLKPALTAVYGDVEGGSSFSAALARQGNVFPPLMVSIVRVGETGGFLGPALESIAENYRKEAELQNKIRAATTYPIIVLIIALTGVLVMVTFIVPVFKEMFAGIGGELPIPTQILVTISNNMVWILPTLIVAIGALWIWWSRNRNTDSFRRRWEPFTLKLPVFGPLATKIAVARFARNLSMMLNAGVPIIQALSIVGQASSNWAVEQAVRDIQESVRQGKSFSAPLANSGIFPTMVPQMVSVGEESGTLAQMLESIASFYEDEVETATEQLSSAIEPILIVGLGILIGSMVISLYLPIFSLYDQLSQQ